MVLADDLQDLMVTGLKTYFHDCFLGTDQLTLSTTQTASCDADLSQLLLNTGILQGSEARLNYAAAIFNPLYSRLLAKLRLSHMRDITMFFGFKATLSAPVWGMTESCAGIFIDYKNDNGTPYFYTGNGDPDHPNYQATPITGMDMSRWLVYEIEGNRFRWWCVPYTVPYFDKNVLPGLKQGMTRKWSPTYTNGSTAPNDTVHYLYFYICNNTGYARQLEVQKVNYAEVYPD
jgi:hypothetical protein